MGSVPSRVTKVKRKTGGKNRLLAPLVLLIVVAAALALFFHAIYVRSGHFIVRSLLIEGRGADSTVDYNELERLVLQKNIFTLDLKKIRGYMLGSYEELFDLKLIKAFPDAIIARPLMRKPVAQVFQMRYYPVDKDGIILSGAQEGSDRLPVIVGVSADVSAKVGKAVNSQSLRQALALIKDINLSGVLKRYRLAEIDVSSAKNVVFFIDDGLEIKIGAGNFAAKLESLKSVLDDENFKPQEIKYVDLRFKEPVIGPKWKR